MVKAMRKILVVDDEIIIRDLLEDFLSRKGYDVYTASDGRAAIAEVKEIKPHIVNWVHLTTLPNPWTWIILKPQLW